MKKRFYLIPVVLVFLGFFFCKTTETMESPPEKTLLVQIKKDVTMDFSGIREAGFRWNKLKSGEQTDDILVKGFMMSFKMEFNDDYSLLNEKVKLVADYLESRGFTPDIYNTSEIASGYRKNSLVCLIVMILIQEDSESDIYTELIIECGQIK